MSEVSEQGPPASRGVWQSPLWAVAAAAVALGLAVYGFASGKDDFGILLVALALVFVASAALERGLHRPGEVALAPGFMLVVALGGLLDDNAVIALLGLSGAICLGLATRGRAAGRAG